MASRSSSPTCSTSSSPSIPSLSLSRQNLATNVLYLSIVCGLVLSMIPAAHAGHPLCGRRLIERMYDVCRLTDCEFVPNVIEFSALDLPSECCTAGCSEERIMQYCCLPSMIREPASMIHDSSRPHKKHGHSVGDGLVIIEKAI